MFSLIRRRLTFANVVMTLVLVFAMSGGAYAAKRYLITSTKQISPGVLAKLRGSAGVNGAQGPAGPLGPQGPAGPKGDPGAPGGEGTAGKEGPVGKEGKQGLEGKQGAGGKEGSPWTAGGVLPSGKSETGSWILGLSSGAGHLSEAISFAIPLSIPPASPVVASAVTKEQVENGELPSGCHAVIVEGAVRETKADPGHLCIFEMLGLGGGLLAGAGIFPAEYPEALSTASKSGVLLLAEAKEAGQLSLGTWIVTAP